MDQASWIGLRDFEGVDRALLPEMCHLSCNVDEEILATFSSSEIEQGRWIEKYATRVESSEISDTKSIAYERVEDVDFKGTKWVFDREVTSNEEDFGDLQALETMNREGSERWEWWRGDEKEQVLERTLQPHQEPKPANEYQEHSDSKHSLRQEFHLATAI